MCLQSEIRNLKFDINPRASPQNLAEIAV